MALWPADPYSSTLIGLITLSRVGTCIADHQKEAKRALRACWVIAGRPRQGPELEYKKLLSPALFNLYMDALSSQLGGCRTGCMIGNTLINHFMYAGDLAIVSPSSAGFQQLLGICLDYGVKCDVKYNAKKSVVMICRTKEDQKRMFPVSYLAGQILSVQL